MQLFLPLLLLLTSLAAALPSNILARGVGPACVHAPYTYGCGTSLRPQCCTKEEYEELHSSSSTSSSSTSSSPATSSTPATSTSSSAPKSTSTGHDVAARGVGPACVHAPYTYGCGTSLQPRCCTKEQYDALQSSSSSSASATTTATVSSGTSTATSKAAS